MTKSLFKMIPCKFPKITLTIECLEECLKYVLLLNFDEEPKYDYLINELKYTYSSFLGEQGLKT